MRLADRTIIVTGASSGLGKAMAAAFVEEGANVACAARTPERLEAAVGEMSGPGEALAVPTDLREATEIEDLVATTRERFGPTDVLVNNAALRQAYMAEAPERKPVAALSIDALDAILETNLRAPFLASRAVLPEMLERDAGRLVHVSSAAAFIERPRSGSARRAPYTASKAGLEAFHDCLSRELDDTGVSSVAFIPPRGAVHTEVKAEFGARPSDSRVEDPAVVAEPAIRLSAGEGENGGRYVARADGTGYDSYSRCP